MYLSNSALKFVFFTRNRKSRLQNDREEELPLMNGNMLSYSIEGFMAAAAADFTRIPDLDVLKDNFTMKLRVIRLWTLECYYKKDEIFSIQGNKIQGYVPNAYIYKFRKVLKEVETFFIKNPNLAKIDESKFQQTDQMQKLTFNRETTITPCLDFS
ncbi:unnamed protein product [Lactuca virosa]|uniref:Replication protein A 70 kDa DNA-binding subunit B/D first OB fold domain-containing protein n=1 Tax=Lactuca virosa TaxID=75947 RepID=A0AAU9M0G3_9ASTR|nr:unnamed protein product [Lactuca virosa]